MENQFFSMLTYFIIYSILGWILESVFRSICERKLINTGFLKGPFCPIYGVGALIMILLLSRFENDIILLFVISFFTLTFWEYVVGIFLEKAFNTKYWDYSDNKFNIQGRICLNNSIYWGILGVLFIKYIHPFISGKIDLIIDNEYFMVVIYLITAIMLVDAINSVIKVKNISVTLEKIDKLNEQIKEKLEELKNIEFEDGKTAIMLSLQKIVDDLNKRKNVVMRRLYKRVRRLKKAFPAIDSKEIAELKVKSFGDYSKQEIIDENGNRISTGLPKSNVLYFDLEKNAWVCVRPSGTEPKIKFYMGVCGNSMEDADNELKALENAVKEMSEEAKK